MEVRRPSATPSSAQRRAARMVAVAAGGVRCRNAGAVAAGAVALLRRVDALPQIDSLLLM